MTENQISKKHVSVGWLIVSTIFLPTGIYAFKKIGKLRSGILIYSITCGIWIASIIATILVYDSFDYQLYLAVFYSVQGLNVIISLVLPMWYIEKWSSEYNKALTVGANNG